MKGRSHGKWCRWYVIKVKLNGRRKIHVYKIETCSWSDKMSNTEYVKGTKNRTFRSLAQILTLLRKYHQAANITEFPVCVFQNSF